MEALACLGQELRDRKDLRLELDSLRIEKGGARGEASRGLVKALACLGQELRNREDLKLELDR